MKFLLLTLLSVSFSLAAFGKPGDCKILIELAIDAAIEVQHIETTIQNFRMMNRSDVLSGKVDGNLDIVQELGRAPMIFLQKSA